MAELTCEQALKACRALLPPERAENLITYWHRAYPGEGDKASEVLVIASLIAGGGQEPSATTALSTARGLESKEAGKALLLIGLAYSALADSGSLTDTIRRLVAEGLQNIFMKFSHTLDKKENITA